jgi:hypothetical protein
MGMITQNTTEIQDNRHEIPANVLHEIPMVLIEDKIQVYILVRTIQDELENYINTGKTGATELNVFSEMHEQRLIHKWEAAGFEYTYRSQQFTYMHKTIHIIYLQFCNPKTGMKVSFIPWFLLPGRKYPVFLYLYAIWHYQTNGRKSLKESTAAAGKLFGADSFNKSTLSRNIKAMENFIDTSRIKIPLGHDTPCSPSYEAILESLPEILESCPSIESLQEKYGEMVKPLPGPVRDKKTICFVLGSIPEEYAKVIKAGETALGVINHDTRDRPARPRKKGGQGGQRAV